MKKLIVLIIILGMTISSSVFAADIVITITIPSAHISRVQAAVKGELHCEGANAKACLTNWLIKHIKILVKGYETTINQQGFDDTYQDLGAN